MLALKASKKGSQVPEWLRAPGAGVEDFVPWVSLISINWGDFSSVHMEQLYPALIWIPVAMRAIAPLFGSTRLAGLNRIRDALLPLYHFNKIIYQKHVEAISILGKPINIYKLNAIILQNMYLTKNVILCRLHHNIQNGIQI